jgi:hypothetical protein
MVPRAVPVLQDHRIDQFTTGYAAPGANVMEICTLDKIQWIERINRVHQTLATPTDHAIHVAASR